MVDRKTTEKHPYNQLAEALGLLIHARERSGNNTGVPAETVGWIRLAQREVERAADVYHETQDGWIRRSRLQACADLLRYARGCAVEAGLPIRKANGLSRRHEVWDLVTRADVLLDEVAAQMDRMAEGGPDGS
jgi:hypothetical protein